MNLQELQQSIHVLFNPTGLSQEHILQAQQHCDNFVSLCSDKVNDLFLLYASTNDEVTKFWLLKTIQELIGKYVVNYSQEQKVQLQQVYFQLLGLDQKHQILLNKKHIRSKYAQILVEMIKYQFPHEWKDPFQMLMALIKSNSDGDYQRATLKLLIKVLMGIEDEIVERNEQKSTFDLEVAGRVKDGIREHGISDILLLLGQTLENYKMFDEEIVNDSLEVLSQLIDWNYLEVFAPFIGLFQNFVQLSPFRTNAMYCLHAVVHKGMDNSQKIQLIVNLKFMEMLEGIQIKFPEREEEGDLEEQENEEEFLVAVAESTDKLGQYCLELFGNVRQLLVGDDYQNAFETILQSRQLPIKNVETLMKAVQLLDTDKPRIGRKCKEFLSFYLQAIKHKGPTTDFEQNIIIQILNTVIKRIQFPAWFKFQEESMEGGADLLENEEDYLVYRDELIHLFLNIVRLEQFKLYVLKTLAQLFQNLKAGVSLNQAELPLFLMSNLYPIIPKEARDQTNNEFFQLGQLLFSFDFLQNLPHKITTVPFFENVVKYSNWFMADESFVNQVLTMFFGEKALLSKNPTIVARTSYLLLRWAEKHAVQLLNYSEPIVNQTLKVIKEAESGGISSVLMGEDELLYLYNIAGLFMWQKKVNHEFRRTIVSQVLQYQQSKISHFLQVPANQRETTKMVHTIKCINTFTKGFQQEISEQMKETFTGVLVSLMGLLNEYLQHQYICEQVLQYLQLCITVLGPLICKYLQQVSLPYINNVEGERIEHIMIVSAPLSQMQLLNQAMLKHKGEMSGTIQGILHPLTQKISGVGLPSSNTSDIEKVQIRLIQTYFKLVHSSLENDINILYHQDQNWLSAFFDFLKDYFARSLEMMSKKIIAQIFKEIAMDMVQTYYKMMAGDQDQQKVQQMQQILQILDKFSKRNKKFAEDKQNPNNSANQANLETLQLKSQLLFQQNGLNLYQKFFETAISISIPTSLTLKSANLDEFQLLNTLLEIFILAQLAQFQQQIQQAFANCGISPDTCLKMIEQAQQYCTTNLKSQTIQDFSRNFKALQT